MSIDSINDGSVLIWLVTIIGAFGLAGLTSKSVQNRKNAQFARKVAGVFISFDLGQGEIVEKFLRRYANATIVNRFQSGVECSFSLDRRYDQQHTIDYYHLVGSGLHKVAPSVTITTAQVEPLKRVSIALAHWSPVTKNRAGGVCLGIAPAPWTVFRNEMVPIQLAYSAHQFAIARLEFSRIQPPPIPAYVSGHQDSGDQGPVHEPIFESSNSTYALPKYLFKYLEGRV